jgi:hypothetical protein
MTTSRAGTAAAVADAAAALEMTTPDASSTHGYSMLPATAPGKPAATSL